jgi:hypothetical protein
MLEISQTEEERCSDKLIKQARIRTTDFMHFVYEWIALFCYEN